MKKRDSKNPALRLHTQTLRTLTDDALKLIAGGFKSEMTCAEQGCERRLV